MYKTKYSCKLMPKYLYSQWVETKLESVEVYSLAVCSLRSVPSCRRFLCQSAVDFPSIFHQWLITIFYYLPLTLYNFSNLLRHSIKQMS